ncbi:glycosyltransferase family 4 protein [Clostridium sp. L74]|uniref:glycosyltransferase family 4 protein n=1 Tax=Clostridium sp. L74 TaxID=1560217 RepID=UPI0006AB7872|nr:glycosyltransferase family 4 protein [Clostridium sp. L74]KOR24084.1 glycoside hydrolase [Clostridium sp. L74]
MNILILANWYPNAKNPINGIFIKDQVKALMEVGLKPIVFFPYDNSIKRGKLLFNIEDGIPTYRCNTDYLQSFKKSKINSLVLSYKWLRRIVKKEKINLIHAHVCYTAGILCSIFKRFNNMPYVITEHRSDIVNFSKKSYNRVISKYAYKRAEKVITVSKFLASELKNLGYKFNEEIIGNEVDIKDYSLSNKINKLDTVRILFVGSMAENEIKGLQYFIPALANYMKKNSNIEMIFIGEGVNRRKYEKMCEELNIKNKCKFLGSINKQDIPMHIKKSNFLVLPSIKETFGCVLIEAMACGKPVLATKCGGPNEFVNNNVGILVEPKNEKALEEGIDLIINRYDTFDPEYIRKYVVDNYSYDIIGKKIRKVYDDILN